MIFPRDRTRLGFVASPAAEPPVEDAPIAPILTLLPASDLGSTSGDHISNDPLPRLDADFEEGTQAGETVRIYLEDTEGTPGPVEHDSFAITSEMLAGGDIPPGTFDPIPPGAWLITITQVNAGGESEHSNAVPYTMNQSLGPVALSVGVSDQTSDTTPDVVLDLSGATVLAGDHAAVIAADGTVLGTADLTTATIASCPVTLSALAQGAHTVRGYVWRDDGAFTELQSYTFTINAALAISGTPVLTATEDSAYAGFTASATGGVAPRIFTLEGVWPAGIVIDDTTGVVSGTPTESGTFADLFVRVTDDEGSTDDLATFTLEVAAAGLVPEYLGNDVSTADTNVYTFSSKSFGAEDANRFIIVGYAARKSIGTTGGISGVTIGGNAAAVHANLDKTSTPLDGRDCTGFAVIAIPAGTTGDIVVTFTEAFNRCGIVWWRALDLGSATPTDTGTSSADPATDTLTVPTSGFLLAIALNTGGVGGSWANATQRLAPTAIESTVLYTAADTVTEGSVSPSFDWTTTTSNLQAASFAAWGP